MTKTAITILAVKMTTQIAVWRNTLLIAKPNVLESVNQESSGIKIIKTVGVVIVQIRTIANQKGTSTANLQNGIIDTTQSQTVIH